MPAEAIHLTAYREAMSSPRVSASTRKTALRFEDGARLGAVLVDLPYFDRFPGEVARYLLRIPARPSPWGARLHDEGPVDLLVALVKLARAQRDGLLSAVALGLASHAAIDRALHPLINALATHAMRTSSLDHGSLHREVEKFQSVCFHEEYAGKDAMGTPAMGRYIAVDLAHELDRHPLGASILRAFSAAFGEAPARSTLARWGRGYRSYVRLLASPLGALMVPERAKPRGREKYLSGPWGQFAPLLERAIAASIPVIELTSAAISATDREESAAIDALLARFPRGTIDDRGDRVDVALPFLVAVLIEGDRGHHPGRRARRPGGRGELVTRKEVFVLFVFAPQIGADVIGLDRSRVLVSCSGPPCFPAPSPSPSRRSRTPPSPRAWCRDMRRTRRARRHRRR